MHTTTHTSTTSTATNSAQVEPFFGVDIFSPLRSSNGSGSFSADGFLDFLGSAWSVYTVLAYIVSILLLVIYVYASVKRNLYMDLQTQQLRDAEKLYDEQIRGNKGGSRLEDIHQHIESENPNDWKLAIIEADVILDSLLKEKGYAGSSLGERLKSISPQQVESLNDAWEAHKIRNKVAHAGADFVLTKRLAQETIVRYQRVFTEFDIN